MASMTEYVSSIRFALNFEDHRNSVQVLAGDSVFFDGSQAKYIKKDGAEVIGQAPSLRSAIKMSWLAPKSNGKVASPVISAPKVDAEKIPVKSGETYDPVTGGNFDELMAKERKSDKVITEEDRTVKKTAPTPAPVKKTPNPKLEVAGDQVEVKENMVVNSSTMVPPSRTHKTAVRRSEDYGADSTTPLRFKSAKKEETPKKNAFTVDSTTPQVSEGASLEEVKRAVVRNEGEAQDAKVIGTIKRASLEVETAEGVTLKETTPSETQEGITFKPIVRQQQQDTPKVVVSSGGTAISEVSPGMDGVTVVTKKAGVNIPPQQEKTDYLSMLPEDWGTLHWAKKEKFVKILTDREFLKFILAVETIKAVQDACTARLGELGEEKSDR